MAPHDLRGPQHHRDDTSVPPPSPVGDLRDTDPLLGFSPIFMPLAGSPARDYGVRSAVDQRGIGRPIGPACDVGATEAGAVVYVPLNIG